MTEDEQKHFAVLVAFAAYCDLSLSLGKIRESSEWAVSKIERLTQENADLKSKVDRESADELTKTIAAMAIINVEKETEIKRLTEENRKLQSKLDSWTQKLTMRDWVTRDLVEE